MAVNRTAIRPDGFTMIPNEWIRDTRLNGNAFRVLAYIASHKIGYRLTVAQIEKELDLGREAVRNAMKALEQTGYLSRVQHRGPGGRLAEVDYNLCDPFDGKTAGRTGDGSPAPGRVDQRSADATVTGNPTGDGSTAAGSTAAGSPDPLNKTRSNKTTTGPNGPAGNVVALFEPEIVEAELVDEPGKVTASAVIAAAFDNLGVAAFARGRLASAVGRGLKAGYSADQILAGVSLWKGKNYRGDLLPYVDEALNGTAATARPTAYRQRQDENMRRLREAARREGVAL